MRSKPAREHREGQLSARPLAIEEAAKTAAINARLSFPFFKKNSFTRAAPFSPRRAKLHARDEPYVLTRECIHVYIVYIKETVKAAAAVPIRGEMFFTPRTSVRLVDGLFSLALLDFSSSVYVSAISVARCVRWL